MLVDRAGKAVANEGKYPFIVEVSVAANGLAIELNREIVGFHKAHRIPARFGPLGGTSNPIIVGAFPI